MDDDFLDDAALVKLTKRKRRDAQVKALRELGIQHRVRKGDGSPVVLWSHVRTLLGGSAEGKVSTPEFVWE